MKKSFTKSKTERRLELESQNKSDYVMQKGLDIITWVMFVYCIAFSILFVLIMILLLAAGFHHIWG